MLSSFSAFPYLCIPNCAFSMPALKIVVTHSIIYRVTFITLPPLPSSTSNKRSLKSSLLKSLSCEDPTEPLESGRWFLVYSLLPDDDRCILLTTFLAYSRLPEGDSLAYSLELDLLSSVFLRICVGVATATVTALVMVAAGVGVVEAERLLQRENVLLAAGGCLKKKKRFRERAREIGAK